jgi:hypothetical protein
MFRRDGSPDVLPTGVRGEDIQERPLPGSLTRKVVASNRLNRGSSNGRTPAPTSEEMSVRIRHPEPA